MMYGELHFNLRQTARLLAHAMTSREHREIYGEEVGGGLVWVKDEGTYLMSTGLPSLPKGEHVVYAEGFGPECDWDYLRDVCGGDDFAEFLGADVSEMVAKHDGAEGWLVIIPDGDTMTIEVRPETAEIM